MPAIQWDEKTMSSGVESVDVQHKKLIAMLNELMDATSQGKGKDVLARMMGFLGDYAKSHFAHEEGVMERHACPAAKANKEAHAKFLQDFTSLAARFEKEGPTLAFVMEVQKTVIDWLRNHIRGCDAQLRHCVGRKAA